MELGYAYNLLTVPQIFLNMVKKGLRQILTLKLLELQRYQFPVNEQKEISDYIEKSVSIISEQKQILTQQILKLKEYKISLISTAVTGKIDVRGYTNG